MPGWHYRIDVSSFFHDDNMPLKEKAEKIVRVVRMATKIDEGTDYDLDEALDELVAAGSEDDVDSFDDAWDIFYDWADRNRAWVETR